jgi:putative endonuclease
LLGFFFAPNPISIAMKFYVYILRSLKDHRYYYGFTSDLQTRLQFHNEGLVKSTKSRTPLCLHYHEEFESKRMALKREKFFKSIDGYNWLKANGIT